jgi:leader peptidase (prepilin peptidase)/N-methyltransferase
VLVLLIAVAVLWGAGTGLLIPRTAYRLAVEPDEPWRTECPHGHLLTGPLGGWLGRARCAVDGAAGADGAADPGAAGRVETGTGETGTGAAGGSEAGGPGAVAPPGPPYDAYGPRTLPVVLVTALVCAALAAATGPRPEVAVWLLAAPVGVLLAVVDHTVHRLPDVLTLPLAAGTAALLGLAALLPADAGSWPQSLLGAVFLGGVYFALFLINSKGMGFGDVKLALALGAVLGWYGWTVLLIGFVVGLVLSAGYGLTLVIVRRAGRKSAIPLGPFMLGGAFLGVLLGAL